MRKTRRIIPYALLSGLLVSCVTDHKLARVRISQPQMKEAVADTGFRLPRQITWTDDKGKEHIVTEATKDSVTGEYITQMELSEITVVAKSKQVAERNGKINLDFIVTVPGELISNKWQVQLTPVAYKSADTLYLDRIFLSGADFAKMQRKGYMRYQAFMNSIIPDSLYLQKLFDEKGYRKALAELEEEYFQAWKHEVISKERWIDWSDKANARFALFNYRMERNKQAIAGYNSILEYLPAYRLRREMDGKYIPSKWKIFAEGNYKIRTRNITPEDSASITRRFTDYAKMAENRKRKEQASEMYEKYVRFPYEAARLDTVIKEGDNFIVLTDIRGDEDALGDMDFKIAGTAEGVTAVQMDIKSAGLTTGSMRKAMRQAHEARLHILGEMKKAIDGPRAELSKYAPQHAEVFVNPEVIRMIIGPGGKNIKAITAATGASVDIEDSGRISIFAPTAESMEQAKELVQYYDQRADLGKNCMGKVRKVLEIGAIVEIMPNVEALVHISQLDTSRVAQASDVAHLGEDMLVKVIEINGDRIRASRKAVLLEEQGIEWKPEDTARPARAPRGEGDRDPRGDRGDRGERRERRPRRD